MSKINKKQLLPYLFGNVQVSEEQTENLGVWPMESKTRDGGKGDSCF